MNLEIFFEKFEQFSGASNAVAKMRELLFELAVQGKLVERVKSDGSGSEILNDAGVTEAQPEGSPPLPGHWVWARLGSMTTRMDSGWSPTCLSEPAETGEWGVLKTTAVQPLEYQEAQNKRLPKNLEPRPEHEVFEGDVLFTRAGPMNRVGILCVARPTREMLMISDKIIRFHLVPGVHPEFAALAMNAGYSSEVIQSLKSGMAASQVNISQLKLRSVPIPIPPLAEQKRIVAKVDELMALCDRLEAQQHERETRHAALARASLARFADAPTPANLQYLFHPAYAIPPAELRKSILTLAVQGKLLSNIGANRRTLGEVIELISGQHLLANEQNDVGKGIPYLTGPADFGAQYPKPSRWTETPKVVAEPGDILITVKGAGVGKTNKLISERTAISRQLMAVRVTGAHPDFVHLVLMNAADHFQSAMTGIAIPGIGRKDVLALELSLPPLAEQRRIVAKVDQLIALVDQLETELATARATAANLMEAVVGELTGVGAISVAPANVL